MTRLGGVVNISTLGKCITLGRAMSNELWVSVYLESRTRASNGVK